MASVNTNYGALVALQNLNSSTKQLDEVQNRISTGLKVSSAKDNGAVFAIAQSLRGRVGALSAVSEGIDRTVTNLDTAQTAGGQVSDILKTLKETAERAKTFTSTTDRASAQSDFAAARDRIDAILNAASVNGVNLLNGTNVASPLTVATSDIGSNAAQTVQLKTGVAAGDATVTAVANLAASTVITDVGANAALTNVATQIYVGTGDQVRINLQDAAGNTTSSVNLDIGSFATLGDLQTAVNTRTGGKVNLTFSGDQLSYNSDQNFSLQFVSGLAVDAAAGASDDQATVDARAQFFVGSSAGLTGATAALAGTAQQSGAAQTGGSQQLALAALSSTQGVSTSTSAFVTSGTSGSFNLNVTRASGVDTFAFTLDGTQTVGQLVNSVNERTGGKVTAAYDTNSRQIVFKATDSTVTGFAIAGSTSLSTFTNTSSASAASVTRAAASSSTANITGFDFRVSGGALAGLGNLDLTTDPSTASSTISTLAATLTSALSSLGAQGRALETQKTFLTSLSDNIEKGIGSLVDADLAKESARLQSLQVKQQLGAQALSIANQGPQILLSFFR